MNYLSVYALIQIVGESFPISSSGNVKLWTTVCDRFNILHTPPIIFSKNVDFLLHIPTLVILLIFFFKRWISYLPWYSCSPYVTLRVCSWILVVDLITCFFYGCINTFELNTIIPLSLGFFITAACLYSTRLCTSNQKPESLLSFKKALVFGLVQSIALLPGISRLASTFAVGRWYGLKPNDALWNSFMIEIPLLIGAALRGIYAYSTYPWYQEEYLVPYGITLIASIIAYGGLCFVSSTADRCTLWKFTWYALMTAAIAQYLGL